ncbi:hypothetical protein [Spirosoma areae]
MKTNQILCAILVALFFTFSLAACKKERDVVPNTSIVFWTKRSDINALKPNCYVDGQLVGTLTKASTVAPACGEPGSLTTQVTPGTHKFEFKTATGQSFNAEVDVLEGQCRTIELN